VDGILIIDKPAGITSHDVVARVRRILKTKRVGHTGTLDPFATGVLVILVGKTTRLAQFIDKDAKEYEAVVRFGFETDTGDRTGSPKPQVPSPKSEDVSPKSEDVSPKSQVPRPKSLTIGNIAKILLDFQGEIDQTPPMYSAKKVGGKRLYESARKGIEVAREPVKVTVHELELIDPTSMSKDLGFGTWDPGLEAPDLGPGTRDLRLRITCSAGTYIRTLAEDIGRRIGVGAHLAELRRTRAGRFGLERSITLDELAALAGPTAALIPMTEAVAHLRQIELNATRADKTKNGLSTRIENNSFKDGEAVRMLDGNGDLVAVGVYEAAETSVRPKVVLV
jgi:tRNA pseudouridine55 synthase